MISQIQIRLRKLYIIMNPVTDNFFSDFDDILESPMDSSGNNNLPSAIGDSEIKLKLSRTRSILQTPVFAEKPISCSEKLKNSFVFTDQNLLRQQNQYFRLTLANLTVSATRPILNLLPFPYHFQLSIKLWLGKKNFFKHRKSLDSTFPIWYWYSA